MKKIKQLLIFLLCMLGLVGCARKYNHHTKEIQDLKVVILLKGERGDYSWIDANCRGIEKLQEEQNIELETVFVEDNSTLDATLTGYGEAKYDLVIVCGYQFINVVNTIAEKYPETFFCMINGTESTEENVAIVTLREYETSFLAGVISGNMMQKGNIGMISAYPDHPLDLLMDVYEATVKEILEEKGIDNIKTLRAYTNSWDDVQLCRTMARNLLEQDMDMLFVYANGAGVGAMEAARNHGARMVSVCTDDVSGYEEDVVVASVELRADVMYQMIIDLYLSGNLYGDQISIGSKEGIYEVNFTDAVSQPIRELVAKAMEELESLEFSQKLVEQCEKE
jgi:basic membrane protein A